ncbi:MAG: hypothetical protein ACRDU4_23010, partial [Mycobacterium sp.]
MASTPARANSTPEKLLPATVRAFDTEASPEAAKTGPPGMVGSTEGATRCFEGYGPRRRRHL